MSKKYIRYCYKYTREATEEDALEHRHSTIMEQVIAASKDGIYNCTSKNPKGNLKI